MDATQTPEKEQTMITTATTLAEYKVANPDTLHMVVSEWWRPVRGFSSIEEAVTFARAGEPYFGDWMVVDVNDSRIRWSWTGNR